MKSAEDIYRALVTEWSGDDVPVLGTKQRLTRLDDLSFAAIAPDATQCMMLLDGLTYLRDDILARDDRAAMAVSLETRVPLLYHRVAELAWRLPLAMKVRDGKGQMGVASGPLPPRPARRFLQIQVFELGRARPAAPGYGAIQLGGA